MDRSRLNKRKISRDKLHYLRVELYCYPDTKRAIASKKLTRKQNAYMGKIVKAIEDALAQLSKTSNGDLKVKLLQDMYWYSRHVNYMGIAMRHHVHYNTVRNWEIEFFAILSEILGLTLFI